MKKFVSVLIVVGIFCVVGAVQAKDWKVIRVATEGAYPPFSQITADGKLVGFDVDIAEALVKAIGAEMKLMPQDWDGIIPALLARKYDAIIASMSITEERKKKVAFTNKYYQTPAKFICKKGSMKDFTRAEVAQATKGKRIGVQRATISDNFISEQGAKDAMIKRYGTQDDAYMDLKAGRVDMLLADSVVLNGGFLQKPEGKDYEFIGPDLIETKYFGEGIGIACRKKNKDLVALFNKAIDQIRADGTYKKIQDKYFDFNVYGE